MTPQPDYEAVAVSAAKRFQAREVLSHWQRWDVRPFRGSIKAACGMWVSESTLQAVPSCPTCKAAHDAFNAIEV